MKYGRFAYLILLESVSEYDVPGNDASSKWDGVPMHTKIRNRVRKFIDDMLDPSYHDKKNKKQSPAPSTPAPNKPSPQRFMKRKTNDASAKSTNHIERLKGGFNELKIAASKHPGTTALAAGGLFATGFIGGRMGRGHREEYNKNKRY